MIIIADRSVMVRLLANVQGFTAGMAQAQAATNQLGEKFKQETQTVGQGLTGIGLAAGAGVGVAVAKFAEFDQAMSFVQAATHESASNMDILRDAALDAGAKTVFSATESANAIEELAKAGISTADVMGGGLAGSLDLAAAGGLGVADAASIAATALTQFSLSGSDVPHVADLLAAGAGKAQGSVEDLSAALNQGGLVASQTGLSIEETTGTLAAFASAGLLGSDAGTSFKTMLQRLTPQSAEAKAKMDELGISAYDAQGNFIGMEQFAGVLRDGLKDLTPEARNAALSVMFGSDAVRAASVIYEQGAEGIGDWISKVDDSGYAAETAAMRLDNLKGDVEALGGAFDTAFIKTGAAANGVLRGMVQAATGLIDLYNGLPAPVQESVLAVGALAAVVGLAGGAFLLAVPKIVEFRAALAVLNKETKLSAVSMSGLAKGVGVLALIPIAQWAAESVSGFIDSTREALGLRDTVVSLTKSLKDMGAEKTANSKVDIGFGTNGLAQLTNGGGWSDALKGLQDFAGELSNVVPTMNLLGAKSNLMTDRMKTLDKSMAEMVSSGNTADAAALYEQLASKTDGSKEALDRLDKLLPQYTSASESSAEATRTSADAYLEAEDKAAGLESQLKSLLDLFMKSNNVNQDAVSANADYQESLAGISEEIQRQKDEYEEVNGTLEGWTFSLDENTAAGAANAEMLNGVAQSAQAAAEAQFQADLKTMSAKDATDKYISTLATSKQALIDQAIANGASAEEVQRLTDKVYAMPTQQQIDILVNTAAAQNTIDEYIRQNQNRVINIEYRATLPDLNGGASGGGRPGLSSGGYTGDGGKYDVAPYDLHRGEYVNNKESTSKPINRRAMEFMNSGGDISKFKSGFATGGYVGSFAEGGYVSGPVLQRAPYMVAAPQQTGGVFQGNLYLSSGEFLGMVRGELAQADTLQRVSVENGLGR